MTTYSVIPVETGIYCGNDILTNFPMKKKVVVIIFVVLIVATGIAEDFFHLNRQLIWAIIIALFGICLFFQGFVTLNRKRLIQNIPTSKINGLALGLVEVIGRAISITPKPLRSLYAKADCVFYRYKVEQFVRTQRSAHWQTISEGSSGLPFYVDDGTGKVLVDPNEARINLEPRYISSSPDELFKVTEEERKDVKIQFNFPGQK